MIEKALHSDDLPLDTSKRKRKKLRKRFDSLMVPSIWLSLFWLVAFSIVLPHNGENTFEHLRSPIVMTAAIVAMILWVWFLYEFILFVRAGRGTPGYARRSRRGLGILLFPAFRLGQRSFSRPDDIWIPFIGWKRKNKKLRIELAHCFSLPMVFIVLMVLPIMAIELFRSEWISDMPWVRNVLGIGQQFIWLAFAYEFVVMIAASRKRLAYCFKHWIDLLIVLLPIVLFVLPFLSFLPILRLARLGRLANLTRMLRMKRLGIKAFQLLALFASAKQIGKNYHLRRISKVLELIEDREEELEDLRAELTILNEIKDQKELEEQST